MCLSYGVPRPNTRNKWKNWYTKVNRKVNKPEIQCFKQGQAGSATYQILPIVAEHRVDDGRMLAVFENTPQRLRAIGGIWLNIEG